MLITNIRYGRTINLGNYESEKIEVEVIPESGQTAEAALEEVRAYVDSKTQCSTTKPAEKKPETKNPPLAKSDPTRGAAPKTTTGQKSDSATANSGNEAPFEPGSDISAAGKLETKSCVPCGGPLPGAEAKPKRGRPRKTPDHLKEWTYTLESESLEELSDRLGDLRKLSKSFKVDEWEAALSEVAKVYRKLNSADADPEIVNQLIASFKSERTSIEEQKRAANESVAA